MPKPKTLYTCSNCGMESPKWSGHCDQCGAWNSFVEVEKSAPLPGVKIQVTGKAQKLQPLAATATTKNIRIMSEIGELDRVLGGGLLPDALTLLTGDPGIGKSTLTLQWALAIAKAHPDEKVLIVSGEESVEQIAERALRLGALPPNLFLLSEYLLENILSTAESARPKFFILDSVQTIASGEIPSAPGSVAQVRTVTEKVMHFIKQRKIPTVLIGHVTKSGEMAGPQVLAHLVDTVLYLEGDRYHEFRLLRSTKNRFGSVFEVGVFEMGENGLTEVTNPSAAFLSGRLQNAIGSVIFPTVEGTRPFLVELQTLTTTTHFGYPKRTAAGVDLNRLSLIIAILHKHAAIRLDSSDVFANVVGGFRLSEPALDLPLALALASAKYQKPLPSKLVALGELGLSGEIRAVAHLEKRLKEAEKLGFEIAVLPEAQAQIVKTKLEILSGKTIEEILKKLF